MNNTQIKLLVLGIFILSSLMIISACQNEGQSCGYTSGVDCCEGLDCQNFQCIDTGSCSSGETKCGEVGYPDISGDVYYKCIAGTFISQGGIDGKCGYVDCGVTGDVCNYGSGCCSPYYICDSNTNKCKTDNEISCGDNICQSGETNDTCPSDCSKNISWMIYLIIGVLVALIIFASWRYFKK